MFPLTCYFLIAVVIQANGSPLNNSDTVLIVGGEQVDITDYPYQVLILVVEKYPLCGGSIIGSEYILTAAHCLFDNMSNSYPISSLSVKVGSNYVGSGGAIYSLSGKIVHPLYDNLKHTFDYDVAVLKTSKEMSIDNITSKIVKMADSKSSLGPGKNVIVTGWGNIQEGGPQSDTLRAVTVTVFPWEYCKGVFRVLGDTFTKRMFCAGLDEGGKDACMGDSGGPVVDGDNLIQYGIVSWGRRCGVKGFPGIYTSVPAVRDWIHKVTGV